MMTRTTMLGVAAALSLFANHAGAEGLPVPPPVEAPAPPCCASRPWTGIYFGFGVGAGAVVHDLSVTGGGGTLGFDGIGGEGLFGTVVVGYDHMIDQRWVVGVFADYDFSHLSSDLSTGGFSASLNHKHSWSVGGRAGILSDPSTLWYALAGYTQAEFGFDSTIVSADLPTFKGWFAGAGVETQLRNNLSLRAEYRFTQLDRETVLAGPGFTVDLEPSMHTARLALTYKFSRGETYSPFADK